jgi:hypothetical protein
MMQVEPLSYLALDSPVATVQEANITIINSDESTNEPAVPTCPAVEKKECCEAPCKSQCCDRGGFGWEWLGSFILWFIVFIVLFWLIFYSLKPPFVLQSDSNQVDTAKVLLAAVISSFILVVLIWLIKTSISK